MTSWQGDDLCISAPLWAKFIHRWWILLTKGPISLEIFHCISNAKEFSFYNHQILTTWSLSILLMIRRDMSKNMKRYDYQRQNYSMHFPSNLNHDEKYVKRTPALKLLPMSLHTVTYPRWLNYMTLYALLVYFLREAIGRRCIPRTKVQ